MTIPSVERIYKKKQDLSFFLRTVYYPNKKYTKKTRFKFHIHMVNFGHHLHHFLIVDLFFDYHHHRRHHHHHLLLLLRLLDYHFEIVLHYFHYQNFLRRNLNLEMMRMFDSKIILPDV